MIFVNGSYKYNFSFSVSLIINIENSLVEVQTTAYTMLCRRLEFYWTIEGRLEHLSNIVA
jgi:hypothetical protein